MSRISLKFNEALTPSDPDQTPILIIGQAVHISQISFEDISIKFNSKVTPDLFKSVVENLKPTSEISPLHLNTIQIGTLPKNCSRNNTPSRAHSITKIIKSNTFGNDEFIVIVCEKRDVFASACAVARAFPVYSRKTKTNSRDHNVTVEFILVSSNGGEPNPVLTSSDIECLMTAVEGIQITGKIIDMPCNEMNTDTFLQEVQRVGDALGIVPHVVRGEELKEKGFGGIYSVGQAACHPPALAVLSHTPPNAKETIALVGKGIVYDTGGLSIKSKTGMVTMKRDCAGAAAILEAFYVSVKLGFQSNLHAVLCLAENAVGPKSTRPDDIITMYSKKTVEVNNTDAEGRLVLGDGVAYADKDLKASIILDMATLTHAQGVCTGKYHAAVLTNSEEWERVVTSAGLISGDLTYPILYCPEMHFTEFGSAIADMKNSTADRGNAQCSCAGLFIGSHLGFDFPGTWIHIDMASPGHNGERATSYGVALLMVLFGHASKNPLLQSVAPIPPQNGPELENCSKKMRLV